MADTLPRNPAPPPTPAAVAPAAAPPQPNPTAAQALVPAAGTSLNSPPQAAPVQPPGLFQRLANRLNRPTINAATPVSGPNPKKGGLLDWYVRDYLRLPSYETQGNPLWTEVVAGFIFWMGLTILAMQLFDTIGLSLYMWENLNALPLVVRIAFTTLFVLVFLQLTAGLDRLIGVEDTSFQFFPLDLRKGARWKRTVAWPEIWRFTKYLMRIALAGFLAFAVADVIVDTLTRTTIAHRQAVIEGRNLRDLRNTEVARLRTQSVDEITKLQETEPTENGGRCRVGTRCEARVQLTRAQQGELAPVNAEIRDQRRAMNCEAEGPEAERCGESGTGTRGAGPIFERKLAALRDMMSRRDAIVARHTQQNAAFTRETSALVAERTSQRDRDILDVQNLSERQLAVRFGDREWQEDRGYFGRAKERAKMEKEDDAFWEKTHTVKGMGLLPFLFLLLQKLFSPKAIKRWFSEKAQAASRVRRGLNDDPLVHALQVDGFYDLEVAALDPPHAEHRMQQIDLFREVEEQQTGFDRYVARVAAMKVADNSRFLTVAEAQALLAEQFSMALDENASFTQAIARVKDAERILTDVVGAKTMRLPTNWVGENNPMAVDYAPWRVTAEDLQRAYPLRVDPEPNKALVDERIAYLRGLRRIAVQRIRDMDAETTRDLRDVVSAPTIAIIARRTNFFTRNIDPVYGEMGNVEQQIVDAGGAIPPWQIAQTNGLYGDPTNYLRARAWAIAITERDLSWLRGDPPPAPAPLPAAAVVVAPPVVAPPTKEPPSDFPGLDNPPTPSSDAEPAEIHADDAVEVPAPTPVPAQTKGGLRPLAAMTPLSGNKAKAPVAQPKISPTPPPAPPGKARAPRAPVAPKPRAAASGDLTSATPTIAPGKAPPALPTGQPPNS